MALTATQVAALYDNPRTGATKRDKSRRQVTLVREDDILVRAHVKRSELGEFIGKVGGITRSRKGATRRRANGWRKYNGYTDVDVVAYLARP